MKRARRSKNLNKKLLIFGKGEFAELAHFYFCRENRYEVAGFILDREFLKENTFLGLPILPFEEIHRSHPPETSDVFVALGYSKINFTRKLKFEETKSKGYQCASFIHPRTTYLSGEQFGENTFIFEDNTIQPFVRIGKNVVIWSGNHLGHHCSIQDHVFITSHVVVSGGTVVGEQCFLGVNSTLRDHITVGERCVLGAGTLLLSDAAPDGVYLGQATERSRVPSHRLPRI